MENHWNYVYCFIVSHVFFLLKNALYIFAAFTGWETKNKYAVTNNKGEMIYYVVEESDICSRLCLGTQRSCEFNIYDRNQQEILRMVRPFNCDCCCCPCCLQVVSIPRYCWSCLLFLFLRFRDRRKKVTFYFYFLWKKLKIKHLILISIKYYQYQYRI